MPDFIVKKKEQWIQPVLVKNAKDEADAQRMALEGHYEIYEDSEHDCDIASTSWEVERIE